MRISEVMSGSYARVAPDATMGEAAEVLSEAWASELMVVEAEGGFVGVLAEGDMLRAIIHHFEEATLSSATLYEAFGLAAEAGDELAEHPISDIIIREPITVSPSDDLLEAAATMTNEKIHLLPVIDDGRLVGTISRADICRALLTP